MIFLGPNKLKLFFLDIFRHQILSNWYFLVLLEAFVTSICIASRCFMFNFRCQSIQWADIFGLQWSWTDIFELPEIFSDWPPPYGYKLSSLLGFELSQMTRNCYDHVPQLKLCLSLPQLSPPLKIKTRLGIANSNYFFKWKVWIESRGSLARVAKWRSPPGTPL